MQTALETAYMQIAVWRTEILTGRKKSTPIKASDTKNDEGSKYVK